MTFFQLNLFRQPFFSKPEIKINKKNSIVKLNFNKSYIIFSTCQNHKYNIQQKEYYAKQENSDRHIMNQI